MVSQAGWRVEQVTVTPRPGGVPAEVFRVSWKGYWQADCATTADVARHLDLFTLVPTGWAHVRSPDYLAKAAHGGLAAVAARTRAQHRPGNVRPQGLMGLRLPMTGWI